MLHIQRQHFPESSDPFATPAKKSVDLSSEWTGSTHADSDSNQSSIKEQPQRRVQVTLSLFNKVKEVFYPAGLHQVYIYDKKTGKQCIACLGVHTPSL